MRQHLAMTIANAGKQENSQPPNQQSGFAQRKTLSCLEILVKIYNAHTNDVMPSGVASAI